MFSINRFLYEKDSDIYRMYREKVLTRRTKHLEKSSDADKYDPAAILHEDDDDDLVESGKIDLSEQSAPITKFASIEDSDEYDSDTEYRQEARVRNLENMKRKIDSGTGVKRFADRNEYESDEDHTDEEDHMEMYRRIQMREDALNQDDTTQSSATQQKCNDSDTNERSARNRKKRSRWGEKSDEPDQATTSNVLNSPVAPARSALPILTAITRTDPALLNYARLNYGTINLSEEDWLKCEEHYKVNLLYQDMLKKRQDIDRLARTGKFKYEYDSDEDTTGV